MSLSTPQIAAQLERVLASDPSTVALAIRAKARQPWPETLNQRGRQFALRWCESSLAIREALCDVEQHDPATAGLVVLTPLATHEIAEDIAARLARARVFQPEGWDIVRQLFQAKETDARLGRFAWMPQCLIDGAAQGPYPPVANGFLGLETAWQEVLQRFLRIPAARPDAVALLNWSMTAGAEATLDQLPAAARADVMRWLAETAGSAGEMVLGCVEAGRTADALPLGLVCGAVFAPEGEGLAPLGQAAIRLERYVNDKHIGVPEGRAWARAAEQVVRSAGLEAARVALERADALLRDLRVAEFAHLSDLLPAALDQRMQDFALALSAHVAEPKEANLAQVELQADRVLRHTLMASQAPRAERVGMARRLARWLLNAPKAATSLPSAVAWQADEGAFVDWARFRLLGGDEIAELSQAYGACREALIARRNTFAKPFAQTLIEWNANKPSLDGRLVPVECVLEHVVAPIAAAHPTLLLVMDGLSISIFRELFTRSASHGWAEMVPAELGQPLVGVAALPTVTEVSRTSLLCGRLTLGAAAQERSGFSTHAALLAHSRAGVPPRLFHKGDLADATNLAPEVRAAIADPHQRVIGVVYNAVDDHLSGPDQLHQRWTLEDLRLLLPLLREAREARRVVVITADHGHLLEDGTAQVSNGGESDRWRPGTDNRGPHELAVSGGRVVTSDGSNTVVCLWGESTRYGGRKNGYHGGLSPQEVTVPLAVMVPLGLNLPGWRPAPPAQPEWWELPPIPKPKEAKPAVAQPVRAAARKPSVQAGQPQLFEETELPPAPAPTAPDWISALLSGPIYASQRQLAARVALPDEKMRALLSALSERGGKLSRAALAQRLALPEIRLGGMLSAVRRMLNVDQAPVLVIDEAAGTVELNIALLHQQFRVSGPGGATMISAARREDIVGALRRGTVPSSGLDALAVGIESFAPTLDEELAAVAAGRGGFKAVRGEYGTGKTFFGRWLQERARARGFAATEVQINETETPLHRLETVYRRLVEHLGTADSASGAFRGVIDGWFYALEQDVLADASVDPNDAGELLSRTDALMEARLSTISKTAPAFSAVLRTYRRALAAGDGMLAEGLISWLAGQPNVAASVKRAAGIKGDLDHFGATNFLVGLLTILRDSGYSGLVMVLDEVETLQRMRTDTREKGLNALRQWIDEIDAGRYPGLYLVVTGTPAFFDGPQGVQRLAPLAQRLHVDFGTDRRFDNPRAVQIRLAPFDHTALLAVGRRVRDIYAEGRPHKQRLRSVVDDSYLDTLARAVAGGLGGKIGVAPRLFLKKLVADILDRVDLHEDFDPRRHYTLTLAESEMSVVERAAASATSVDDIELP